MHKEQSKELTVTIRCLVYNHEPYLRQCLEGFVMQKTNFRFEAIVHDDASTDGSANIILEYAEKYPDIIKPIIETENQYSKRDGSLRRIMNAHTHGKYIAFCEGDDYWTDPLKLQKQVDFLENNPEYSMCFHNVNVIAENCNLETDIYSHLENRDYNIKELLIKWSVPTCSILMRGFINEKVPINKKFAVGDNVLITTCALFGKIRCINELMGCYRRNANGWTNMNSEVIVKRFIGHYDAMLEFFPKEYSSIFKNIQANFYYSLVKVYMRKKDFNFLKVMFDATVKLHIYFVRAVFKNLLSKISKIGNLKSI